MAKGDLTFNSDGTYSFDPNGDFEDLSTGDSEQVTFTYRAVDNDGGQSAAKTVTITVNGVNDTPCRDRQQQEHRRGHRPRQFGAGGDRHRRDDRQLRPRSPT